MLIALGVLLVALIVVVTFFEMFREGAADTPDHSAFHEEDGGGYRGGSSSAHDHTEISDGGHH